MAWAFPKVRRKWIPSRSEPSAFSRRTIAPVAISALPNSTSSFVDSFARRASVSSFMTDTRVSTSTSSPRGRSSASARVDCPDRYDFDSGGRSYGGSFSRPTTTTDPSAPPSRSARAHDAAATPPPISRKSAWRSATSGVARPAVRSEARRDLVLEPGVEHEQDLVAGLHNRVGERHEARAVAQDRDHERALGHADVLDHLPGRRRSGQHLDLDDLEPLLGQVEQVQQADARDLVLDQAQDQVGRRHRRLHAEQLEVLQVARVVAARDHAVDAVLLARDLADKDVVLVVAGHRDHEVSALDPGALEHPQLRAVAVLNRVLELLLDRPEAVAVVLDHGQPVALADQLASQVPADLAGADDDHVHLAADLL